MKNKWCKSFVLCKLEIVIYFSIFDSYLRNRQHDNDFCLLPFDADKGTDILINEFNGIKL